MEKIGNVFVFSDDEEIIETLVKLPPSEEFDNMNILRFMQERTKKSDFGGVVFFDNIIYTIYKFDKYLIKPEEAGLLMTTSNSKFAMEQLDIWVKFKNAGMSFSEKIFDIISNGLISGKAVQIFYNNAK